MDLHRLGLEFLPCDLSLHRLLPVERGLGGVRVGVRVGVGVGFIAFFRSREAWAEVGLGSGLGLGRATSGRTELG